MLFSHGKLALSSAAIKVAAEHLKQNHAPEHVIMAGLRHDNPYPCKIGLPKTGDIPIGPGPVWVFGCAGSGKTELFHTASVDLARVGYRTLLVSGRGYHHSKWSPDESRSILLSHEDAGPDGINLSDPDWPNALDMRMREHFSEPAVFNVTIVIPFWMKMGSDSARISEIVMDTVSTSLPPDVGILIENVILHGDALDGLRRILNRTTPPPVFVSPEMMPGCLDAVKTGDPKIFMRMVGPNEHITRHAPELTPEIVERCSMFFEGMGILSHDGEMTEILVRYDGPAQMPRVLARQPAGRAIEALKARLSSAARPGTHMGRFEAVSRACGYRSWHAAQGRRG